MAGKSWDRFRNGIESAKLQVERFNAAAFEEYGQASVNLPGQPGETATVKESSWEKSQSG